MLLKSREIYVDMYKPVPKVTFQKATIIKFSIIGTVIGATMYYDGRYKIVNYHGKDFGELYDHQTDPNEFRNLWDEPDHALLKAQLIKKNFDAAIMKNMDLSMNRINEY